MKPKAERQRVKGVYERIPKSDVWWIRYVDHRGKEHREKVGRRSDAITLYNKRKTEAIQHKKLPENFRVKGITFAELCKDALEHSKGENSAKSTHELELKINELLPTFGHMSAENITKQDIKNWLKEETEKRDWKPASRNRWQAAFSLIFRVGIDNEKITVNPAARIRRITENNGRIRFLSADEETKLKAVVTDWRQLAAIDIAIHTGMRQSEEFGMMWSQVSLERKQITLHKTKNGKPRHIPLNAVALAAFESLHSKRQPKEQAVFPSNRGGDHVQGARGWFKDAVQRTGLLDFTWHDLRHTFASRLVMAGVDLRTVGDLMGHSTAQMTMRYAHLAPEHKASAVEALLVLKPAPVKSAHQEQHVSS